VSGLDLETKSSRPPVEEELFSLTSLLIELIVGSMHYERAALLRGFDNGDVGQESEEKIGKSAEE
jgi:hypothetical protein